MVVVVINWIRVGKMMFFPIWHFASFFISIVKWWKIYFLCNHSRAGFVCLFLLFFSLSPDILCAPRAHVHWIYWFLLPWRIEKILFTKMESVFLDWLFTNISRNENETHRWCSLNISKIKWMIVLWSRFEFIERCEMMILVHVFYSHCLNVNPIYSRIEFNLLSNEFCNLLYCE